MLTPPQEGGERHDYLSSSMLGFCLASSCVCFVCAVTIILYLASSLLCLESAVSLNSSPILFLHCWPKVNYPPYGAQQQQMLTSMFLDFY